jgi:predicted ATPase
VISSIEISRFRGIREGKLEDLTPLVVLVGPNGCGKSTVLDGLLIGASSATQASVARCVLRHPGVTYGARWLFWRAEQSNPAEITLTTSSNVSRRCRLACKVETADSLHLQCDIDLQTAEGKSSERTGVDMHLTPGRNRSYRFSREKETAPLDDARNVCLIDGQGDQAGTPLHELYSETVRTGRGDEARAIITELVSGIRDIEILTEADAPVLYFVYDDCAVPVALAGDGIYALVRATLELASRPEGLVLLEEPEVHKHPGAIRQTTRAILAAVRRNIQVIMTTHSLELIDALLAESSEEDLERLSLYRLELEDGRLISVRLPGSEVAFSRGDIEKDLR